MADLQQINDASRQLASLTPGFEHHSCASLSDLERHYSITYRAPYDMRDTDLPDNSMDCCVSTYTLEHVPEDSIVAIFKELKRVIWNGGLIPSMIDYSDHYSHTDKTIGPLNFLSFEAAQWERYNHPSHFQNRMRHYDYRRILTSLGFVLELDEPSFTSELPASIFADFDRNDPTVHATSGCFLLRVVK